MCRGPRFFSPDRAAWAPRFWWARGATGCAFPRIRIQLAAQVLVPKHVQPPRKFSRGGGATFDSFVPETAPSDCSGPCAGVRGFFRPIEHAGGRGFGGPAGGVRISSNPDPTCGVSACSKACATPRANSRAGGGATFDSFVPETAPSDCSAPCAGVRGFFRPIEASPRPGFGGLKRCLGQAWRLYFGLLVWFGSSGTGE